MRVKFLIPIVILVGVVVGQIAIWRLNPAGASWGFLAICVVVDLLLLGIAWLQRKQPRHDR